MSTTIRGVERDYCQVCDCGRKRWMICLAEDCATTVGGSKKLGVFLVVGKTFGTIRYDAPN